MTRKARSSLRSSSIKRHRIDSIWFASCYLGRIIRHFYGIRIGMSSYRLTLIYWTTGIWIRRAGLSRTVWCTSRPTWQLTQLHLLRSRKRIRVERRSYLRMILARLWVCLSLWRFKECRSRVMSSLSTLIRHSLLTKRSELISRSTWRRSRQMRQMSSSLVMHPTGWQWLNTKRCRFKLQKERTSLCQHGTTLFQSFTVRSKKMHSIKKVNIWSNGH